MYKIADSIGWISISPTGFSYGCVLPHSKRGVGGEADPLRSAWAKVRQSEKSVYEINGLL